VRGEDGDEVNKAVKNDVASEVEMCIKKQSSLIHFTVRLYTHRHKASGRNQAKYWMQSLEANLAALLQTVDLQDSINMQP
jgi:hypothetical protein